MFRLKLMVQDPSSLSQGRGHTVLGKKKQFCCDLSGGTYLWQSNVSPRKGKKGSCAKDKWPDNSCVGQHMPFCSGRTSGIPKDSSGVSNVFV